MSLLALPLLADLSLQAIAFFVLAAFIVGFSKTSVGGVGILAVVLMALAFPGKASPGILLPMLIIADIVAVLYYRRSCQWSVIARIFPLTALGVLIGYFIVEITPQHIFEIALGGVILAMLALSFLMEKQGVNLASNRAFTIMSGLMAGVATMMGNAAGPIFGVYLLQMGLSKSAFVGTRSWFFLLINLFKIPFSIHLGLITPDTLMLNAIAIPVLLSGGFLGFIFLKYINLEVFKILIRITVVIAAVRLILF